MLSYQGTFQGSLLQDSVLVRAQLKVNEDGIFVGDGGILTYDEAEALTNAIDDIIQLATLEGDGEPGGSSSTALQRLERLFGSKPAEVINLVRNYRGGSERTPYGVGRHIRGKAVHPSMFVAPSKAYRSEVDNRFNSSLPPPPSRSFPNG
jgi:hypothetical protein